ASVSTKPRGGWSSASCSKSRNSSVAGGVLPAPATAGDALACAGSVRLVCAGEASGFGTGEQDASRMTFIRQTGGTVARIPSFTLPRARRQAASITMVTEITRARKMSEAPRAYHKSRMRFFLALRALFFVILLPGTIAGYVPYRMLVNRGLLRLPEPS